MEKMAHVISFLGTLAAFFIWIGGYFSGSKGWWWSVFGIAAVYLAIYKML